MNERKRMTLISVLEIVVEADPFVVPEETLYARAALRAPRPTLTEVREACQWLEQQKALSHDVAPYTEVHRFSTTAESQNVLRKLQA